MANKDWDLDDLLNFKFDGGEPEKSEEMKRYEEARKQGSENAPAFDTREIPQQRSSGRSGRGDTTIFGKYKEQIGHHSWFDEEEDILLEEEDAPRPPVEEVSEHHDYGLKEIEAIKQASQEAYDRYRSNYTKNKKKRARKIAFGRADRILTGVYLATLAIFAASMLIMNVLPVGWTIALFVILILLSLFLFIQTRRRGGKVSTKRIARIAAVMLIAIYSIGSFNVLGTLSFLSDSSVKNGAAVSDITRHPFNFIITGIDVDGTIDAEGRSDVNMVVTVNPKTGQILMTSIPRDYEVYMPDFDNAMDKLTHTGFYGVPTTIGAEEQLLDTKVNYYVKVNFTTVERFIDAIGGVDVESEYEFTPVKLKSWTVQKGMNHMNGKQALAFARERKAFPAGDNQRIKNQQLVFEALIKKATSSRTMILSYNRVLSSLRNYFEMSFSSREIRKLMKYQLAKNPDWKIFKNTIVGGDGSLPTYSTGGEYAYVMTQDYESIENAKTLINAVLGGQDLQTDENGIVTVAGSE